jgi:hypothetical protein
MKPKLTLILLAAVLLGLFAEGGRTVWAVGEMPPKPAANPSEALKEAQLIALKLDAQTELPQKRPLEPPLEHEGFFLPLILKILFLAAVGFIAFIFLKVVIAHLQRPKAPSQPKKEEAPALAKSLDMIQRDSQELAQGGFFAEAIHGLLLKSLKEFQKRQGVAFAPSLTSREILARLSLGPPVEPALAFIVDQVEISRFGRFTPGDAEYQTCLARFQDLVKGLGGLPA